MSQISLELPSKKIRDIRGERFGRLLVESFSHVASDKGKNAYWQCVCDCGNEHTVSSASLRTGTCVSCGCYASEVSRRLIKETHNKGAHLYFIKCGEYIKIGRADNVAQRLSQLRAANPYDVELVYIVEGAGDLEHSLHKQFKDRHHTGEWFRLNVCEIVSVGAVQDG